MSNRIQFAFVLLVSLKKLRGDVVRPNWRWPSTTSVADECCQWPADAKVLTDDWRRFALGALE
jgi:hypothetical protein